MTPIVDDDTRAESDFVLLQNEGNPRRRLGELMGNIVGAPLGVAVLLLGVSVYVVAVIALVSALWPAP